MKHLRVITVVTVFAVASVTGAVTAALSAQPAAAATTGVGTTGLGPSLSTVTGAQIRRLDSCIASRDMTSRAGKAFMKDGTRRSSCRTSASAHVGWHRHPLRSR